MDDFKITPEQQRETILVLAEFRIGEFNAEDGIYGVTLADGSEAWITIRGRGPDKSHG